MTTTQTDRIYGVTASVALKAPCRAATTAAIALSGAQTIDGVACVAGDRVLVKNQADATANGIYLVANSAWGRDADFDGSRDVVCGTMVAVVGGSTNASTAWQLTTADPIAIGSSALTFARASITGINGDMYKSVYDAANIQQQVVGTTATQTMSNKTLTDASTFIADDGDATKKLAFQCSGISTATTRTVAIPDKSGTMALTSDLGQATGSFTRDVSTATGSQSVTGVGFTPRVVHFLMGSNGKQTSTGIAVSGASRCVYQDAGSSVFNASGTVCIYWENGGGVNYQGSVSSLDADGFTVSWTKNGSPTGTATIQYLAIK